MTRPINLVTLTGRLVADPEINTSASGNDWAKMRIAVDYSGRNAKNPDDKTGFFNVTHFLSDTGAMPAVQTAKLLRAGHLKKGSAVSLVGELRQATYENKQGGTAYDTEIVADSITFAGGFEPREKTEAGEAVAPAPMPEQF